VVVFRPLGENELRRILDIELNQVQQRIFDASGANSFVFSLTEMAKQHLLDEGTDIKYGARHLKRAIEKLLIQPLSNLIATEQVHGGDWVRVDYSNELSEPHFVKEAEGLPAHAMAEMVDESVTLPVCTMMSASAPEPVKIQSAKSNKRG
jgi:ATP-dependent Clp protease ATP-binding subunit ClpA